MAIEEVERKVYFFRLLVSKNEDGSTPPFSLKKAFSKIEELRFDPRSTGNDSRYLETSANSLVCAWPIIDGTIRKLKLGRIRRRDLPGVENAGTITDLPLGPRDGIVDTTHIQFFDNNIVGAEFNFYAPRATSFSDYCRDKVPALPHFRLWPLLHRNAAKQLDDLEDIRLLSVKVVPSKVELLERINESIPAALEAVDDQYGTGTVELILRAPPRGTLAKKLITAAKALIKNKSHPTDDFKSLRVKGLSESLERVAEFDLLKDRFISLQTVAKIPGRSRTIDSDSMFAAIEDAYNELKSELEKARCLGLE